MKKNKYILAALPLVAALVFILISFIPTENKPDITERTLLIATDDDTGFSFLQLREGAQAAASKNFSIVHVLSTKRNSLQLKDIKPDAVIVSMKESAARASFIEKIKDIPYIIVNNTDENAFRPDEKAGAIELCQATPEHMSIVSVFSEDNFAVDLRLEGLKSVFPGMEIHRLSPGTPLPYDIQLRRACLALDKTATEYLIMLKELGKLPSTQLILGYDIGSSAVEDIFSGRVYALLMDSPYSLGYKAATEVLTGIKQTPPSGRVITKSNMFDSENVRLMFPLLQAN
jgi:ABC-type sugar transport system substrate-binding protein